MLSETDSATAIQIARDNYYSNPFWSDRLNPTQNAAVLHAVGVAKRSEIEFQRRIGRQLKWSLILFVLAVPPLLFYVFSGKDWSQPENSTLLLAIVLLSVPALALSFLIFLTAHPVASFAWNPYHQALKQVSQDSWGRYQAYLERLSRRDPGLYASVQLWHQQEESLRLSRVSVQQQATIIRQNSEIISAQQRTANELAQARIRDQNRPR
jgi:hypothetical protein